jgi:hypothetical protein
MKRKEQTTFEKGEKTMIEDHRLHKDNKTILDSTDIEQINFRLKIINNVMEACDAIGKTLTFLGHVRGSEETMKRVPNGPYINKFAQDNRILLGLGAALDLVYGSLLEVDSDITEIIDENTEYHKDEQEVK